MKRTFFTSCFNRTHKVIFAVILVTGLGLLLNSSFVPVKPNSMFIYKPANNFSFIKRFNCISDLFGKDQWHNNKGRSFDEDGVHLTNAKKHPVNACHYALFCFDEYKATGDTAYYNAFMAQVKYLRDSTFYHEVDTDKVAYPYFITFHDLKPPWYSALAQSEAISVLIRYYSLSGDDSVLPLLVKLKNFMVSSQEFGCGTMSITPEGNQWFEEYPNSKQEKQVLNGFFLAIVALHEYTHLFPEDIETKAHYEAAIKTVKESFKFYDTGSWLKYNRGDGRQVSNGYMKWQVLEMKLLYELTGDIYFKHLMMLISTYCYNKPYETPGSKLQDYDFSVPMKIGKNEVLESEGKSKAVVLNSSKAVITTPFKCTPGEMLKIVDENTNTFARFKYADSLEKTTIHITFDLKSRVEVGSFTITYAGLDSLTKPVVALYYKDSVSQKKLVKADILSVETDVKSSTYKINRIKGQSFSVVFENMNSFESIQISNLAMYEPATFTQSDYVHYLSPVYKSGESEAAFQFEHKGMRKIAVFQKSAGDDKLLKSEKWNPLTVHTQVPVVIPAPKSRFYQFLIVCEPLKSSASIGKVKFID